MTDLTIAWQRLVDAGQIAPAAATPAAIVRTAAATLTAALAPLGITVRLAEATINLAQFEQAPLESNRILIAGRPSRTGLGGATSQSPCCDVCGPNDCRTITVDDTTYETVPAGLITSRRPPRRGRTARPAQRVTRRPHPGNHRHNWTCCGPTAEPTDLPEPFTAAGNQGRLLLRPNPARPAREGVPGRGRKPIRHGVGNSWGMRGEHPHTWGTCRPARGSAGDLSDVLALASSTPHAPDIERREVFASRLFVLFALVRGTFCARERS